MEEKNLGTQNNGQGNNGNDVVTIPAKRSFIEEVRHRWTVFKTTKGGRWAIRGGKALLFGGSLIATGKKCYDAGKKSVKPTIVYVQPEQPEEPSEEETQEETPAEEPAAEENEEI